MNPIKTNYQKELDKITEGIITRPSLLLHACCAPCSSYCLEYLREYFDITVYYYNPNITSEEEYLRRYDEEERLIGIYNAQVDEYESTGRTQFAAGMRVTPNTGRIALIGGAYEPEVFAACASGYEECPEGGDRCRRCFDLRLRSSFDRARMIGADYVTTTLTISPLKSAELINTIGMRIESESESESEQGDDSGLHNTKWLPSDFKKKEGYKRSIELSAEFGLYRQNFCGCVFSQRNEEK